MEYELIRGHRLDSGLLYVPSEKHLCAKKTERSGRQEFICYQTIITDNKKKTVDHHPKCTARVFIHGDGRCTRNRISHSVHEHHETIYNDLKTLNAMKDKCLFIRENFPETSHSISAKAIFYGEMVKRVQEDSKLKFEKVKGQLGQLKSKQYPKIPKTLEQIRSAFTNSDLYEFCETLDKSAKFYIDMVLTAEYSFCLFASLKTIYFIIQNITKRCYLIDGTFKVAPSQFYQLLIISIEFENDIFPVFYVLMTRKTTECYSAVFEFIENNIFRLEPHEIITDFEEGMRNAIRKQYPNSTLRGCWFHFCAAIRKKSLKCRLNSLLKSNSYAKLICKELMGVPLLPSQYIEEGYLVIKNSTHEYGLLENFKKLFEYFETYWLVQNAKNSISVSNINIRTTSSKESLNSRIGRSFPRHPNIFKFVDCLKSLEFQKRSEMLTLKDNVSKDQFQRKRKNDREREKQIEYFSDLLKNREISVREFLEAMASRVVLPSSAFQDVTITINGDGDNEEDDKEYDDEYDDKNDDEYVV